MEKPKDNGEARKRVGIMLGLVDGSDEVVALARLKEWSKLVLFIASLHGSEAAMSRTQRASEGYRGNRIQLR